MPESDRLDIDVLRNRLAMVHGLVLSRDDPVFALIALNKELLQHHLDQVTKGVDAAQLHVVAGMAAATDETLKRAEQTAARVVGAANELATETVAVAAAEATKTLKETAAGIIARVQQAADDFDSKAKRAQSVVRLAYLVGGALLALAVGMFLGRFLP